MLSLVIAATLTPAWNVTVDTSLAITIALSAMNSQATPTLTTDLPQKQIAMTVMTTSLMLIRSVVPAT
jgi:hypothetical protein